VPLVVGEAAPAANNRQIAHMRTAALVLCVSETHESAAGLDLYLCAIEVPNRQKRANLLTEDGCWVIALAPKIVVLWRPEQVSGVARIPPVY